MAPLKDAAELLREAGDPDAELVALAHIGRMAWWWQRPRLLSDLAPRVHQLHLDGHAKASAPILGRPGRAAVRALAEGTRERPAPKARSPQARQARQAKALLAGVPAPPPHVTHLGVLGPLTLRTGDPSSEPVDVDLEPRPRALLAFLVGHRRTRAPRRWLRSGPMTTRRRRPIG